MRDGPAAKPDPAGLRPTLFFASHRPVTCMREPAHRETSVPVEPIDISSKRVEKKQKFQHIIKALEAIPAWHPVLAGLVRDPSLLRDARHRRQKGLSPGAGHPHGPDPGGPEKAEPAGSGPKLQPGKRRIHESGPRSAGPGSCQHLCNRSVTRGLCRPTS